MASIQQRSGAWLVQWTDPASQKRKSRRFGNHGAAERFAGDRDNDRELVRQGLATPRQVSERRYVLSVDDLCDRFTEHARVYYRKANGRATSTVRQAKMFLGPLRQQVGPSPAADFGPLAFKRVREAMVAKGWSRSTANHGATFIRQVYRWGVEHELVPASSLEALRAVAPLKRGRCDARDTEPVRPVPAAFIRTVRRHLSRQVWAMIELQRLSGMRPGEVVAMRACDLDTSGKVWTYTPAEHKTEHHGHARTVYLGPRAQLVLRSFLRPELKACLFSPREAERERHDGANSHRREGQPQTPRKTARRVGEHYTTESYRRAIARGCEAAGVPTWSPNQLRHNAATRLRREYGIEIAQTILGHRLGSSVTEVYAEANTRRAREVVAEVG